MSTAEIEADLESGLESDGESDGAGIDEMELAQLSDEDFETLLAQIDSTIDDSEKEHHEWLAQLSTFMATLDPEEIDKMDRYMA